MTYSDNVVQALQTLRAFATGPTLPNSVRAAVNQLDNAGVFAAIDEQTDYDVDREPPSVTMNDLDAAEWGDTTRADVTWNTDGTYNYPEPEGEGIHIGSKTLDH